MTALLVRYKIAAFTPNGYPVYHSNHLQLRNFYIFKEWKESTATTVNTWNLAVRISIIYIYIYIYIYTFNHDSSLNFPCRLDGTLYRHPREIKMYGRY